MYFDTEIKQKQLLEEFESWLETPYKHRCMVKGKGVDCIHLIAGGFINLKAIKPTLKYPEYDPDWHLHNSRELLYEYIHKNINVKEIYNKKENIGNTNDIRNGDICLYRYGKASAHAGLYIDEHVYHSLTGMKVTKSVFKDAMWHRRLTFVLRLK